MKKYVWITLLVVVALVGSLGYAAREITFAHYANADVSAQQALDNTVLNKITDGVPYTGGMQGYCFTGTDKQGRVVYAWTEKGKVVSSVYADLGLNRDKVAEALKKPVWAKTLASDVKPDLQPLLKVVEVLHAIPGPVLQGAKTQYRTAPSKYVWEVYGTFDNGKQGYTYVDFKSGEVLWQYVLDNPA
jgi:uncharacterized protein YpmB